MNELQRYELVSRIAVGGMAEVFRAKAFGAHGFEKPLAIKRILPHLAANPEFLARFIEEAKVAVSLTHANVVQVIDFGRFGGSLYIAMEYVDGPDLAHLLEAYRDGSQLPPLAPSVYVAMEVLKGLDFAHRRGIVHRDVSPSNILLSRAGEVKVADFGIAVAADASLSIDRRVMGKWRYMSPEQAEGRRLDARSDLFSVGTVIHELLTGQRLFPGGNIDEVVQNLRRMDIPPASSLRSEIPPAIDGVLARLLQREPEARYERAADALRALVEVSFQSSLMATAEDVSCVIEHVLPAAAERTGPPIVAGAVVDDFIASELSEKNDGGTWRTEHTGAPASMTFVPQGTGPDGLTQWKSAPAATRAPAPALALVSPEPARRGPVGLILVLAATLIVAVSALLFQDRSGPPQGVDAAPGQAAIVDASTSQTPPVPVPVPVPTPAIATLVVRSEPPGATVTLDGRTLGVTPLDASEVPADDGPHTLRVELVGHEPHSESLVLAPGAHFHLHPQLQPTTRRAVPPSATPRSHEVFIWSDPWAEVYLGGKKVGETQGPVRLPEGKHRLTLVNPVENRRMTLPVTVPSRDAYRVKLP